ncbi:hypothetical protein [Bacillus rubiinfantis]|uniref:hypothetical protein n=1 Tax=Bacillus rubiinfantis TaxID=1499680 RepID=UPI0005AB2A1C|nr:hypothetical protein [Bacillus rubiinfantis]
MMKPSQLEKLTPVQLIQKIIHLNSELSLAQVEKEQLKDKYRSQIRMLQRQHQQQKGKLQELLFERDEHIKDINGLSEKLHAYKQYFAKFNNGDMIESMEAYARENHQLHQTVDELEQEISLFQRRAECYETEIANLKSQIEKLQQMAVEEQHLHRKNMVIKTELEKIRTENSQLAKENETLRQLVIEFNKTREEEQNHANKKTEYEQRIAELEEQNTSYVEQIAELTKQRTVDKKRIDHISTNIQEVFTETKQLVSMTAILKQQLEAKHIELNQAKKDKQLLVQQLVKLNEIYEQSLLQKQELESKITELKEDFLQAQQTLLQLEQMERESGPIYEELQASLLAEQNNSNKYKEELEIALDENQQLNDKLQLLQSLVADREELLQLVIKLPIFKVGEKQPTIEELRNVIINWEDTMETTRPVPQPTPHIQKSWLNQFNMQCVNSPRTPEYDQSTANLTDFFSLKRKVHQFSNTQSNFGIQGNKE